MASSSDTVTELPDGGIHVNNSKLNEGEVGLLIGTLAQSGALLRHLKTLGRTQDLAALTLQLLEADQKGDVAGQIQATARILRFVNSKAGMVTITETASTFTPEIGGLPEALLAGAEVARDFPLQVLNAEPDADKLRDQATRMQHIASLQGLYAAGGAKAKANLAALAREAAPKVQLLCSVLAPALAGNEDLAARALPLFDYKRDTVERAQATRQLLERNRAEVTGEVTAALYDKARAEARAEVKGRLDDRLAAVLEGEGDDA